MPRKKPRIQNPEPENDVNETINFSIENQENNGVEIYNILSIFRECEDSHAHDRIITQLKINFYDKLHIDEFCEDFFNCCRFIMSVEDRVKSEIPLSFAIKFVIFCINKASDNHSKDMGMKLMKRLIKFITWHHDMQQSHARFNAVKALKILLNELTDEIEIPDIFYEKIQDALLKRFWDIKSFIRAEAAQASSRLQSPSDADCAIVISLIHLCKYDSSHTVRLAAMQALAITTKTLPVIITRCRDVNDLVRKKSFDLLIKWKILKPLTVSKRLQIMETGLMDKSEIVRNACGELLRVWFHSSGSDPIALLKRLDVENMEEVTDLTLTTLLRGLSEHELSALVDYLRGKMDDKHLVAEEHLNSEMAFFWKHLVILLNDKHPDKADAIVPSIPDFECYIRRLFLKPMEQIMNREVNLEESIESYTIIKHLLPIVKFMDIFDEHNRQKMIEMIKWALSSPNIPFNYVEHILKLLVQLESDNEKICNLIVELINELLYSDIEVLHESSVGQSDLQTSHEQVVMSTETTTPDPVPDEPTITQNKETNRRVRLEIAEVEVRINELNESIGNCMRAKMFDQIENLICDLKSMTEKKNELVNLLSTPPSRKNIAAAESETEPILIDDDKDMVDVMMKEESKAKQPWMVAGMEHKILKANVMTVAMIQECNLLWTMPPSLRALFDNVVLTSVQHSDLCVRQKAILSMGLCCLLDKGLAVQYFRLFTQILLIDHESVKEIAAKSVIDMFIRFGIEPFQDAIIASKDGMSSKTNHDDDQSTASKTEPNDSTIKHEKSFATESTFGMTEEDYNKCTTELMAPIIDLLNSQNSEMQSAIAIGLSKLLYYHKLMSSKLLSRLLLLWFNPLTEDNTKLRQYLGAFFTNFSLMSAANQEAITNCFLITMRTLFKAPAKSPLLDIDFNNVISFFERVTDSKYLIDNRTSNVDQSKLDNPCHDSLAITISNQILSAPLSSEIKYYVPMLLRLRLSPDNIDVVATLVPMVGMMTKKIKDKKCIMSLERWNKTLTKRLEESGNVIDHSPDVGDDGANDAVIQAPLDDTVETSKSKPSLLELGSDGRKMNETYLGGVRGLNRLNQPLNDTISQLSSINIVDDDNYNDFSDIAMSVDSPLSSDSIEGAPRSQQQPVVPSSTRISTNMPPPSMSGDERVFRKPKNVRHTQSSAKLLDKSTDSDNGQRSTRSTRSQGSPTSSISSLDSVTSAKNVRVTKRLTFQGSVDSSIVSIDSTVSTSTRLTRSMTQRNK